MQDIDVYNLLHHSSLENQLTPNELEMLITYSQLKKYAADEMILQQGKNSDGIYIIIEGTVSISGKILGEIISKLDTLSFGNFLGEISFILNMPSATSAIANTNVQCLLLDNVFMEMISAYYPELKYKIYLAITKQVCNRLRKLHDYLIKIISGSEIATQSFFIEMIHSLTKTTQITFADCGIDINAMRHLHLFSLFSDDECDELFKHISILKAPKDCTLIHKGEMNPACYIVLQGAVQSCIIHEKKVVKLSVIGPVLLFSSIACVDHTLPFTISFITCEPAILIKISEPNLKYIRQSKPILWYKLFSLICKSLVALEKSVDKLDIRLNVEIYNVP